MIQPPARRGDGLAELARPFLKLCVIPRLRDSAWMSAFLDAVNVSALALMVAVTIDLGVSGLVSWPAWIIAVAVGLLVLRYRTNAVWLVLGGAVVGRALWPRVA